MGGTTELEAGLSTLQNQKQKRHGLYRRLAVFAVAGLTCLATTAQLTSLTRATRSSHSHVVPMNAQSLKAECASLYTLPGEPLAYLRLSKRVNSPLTRLFMVTFRPPGRFC